MSSPCATLPTRYSLLLLAALTVTPAAATVITTAIDEDDGELGGGSGVSLREAVAYSQPDSTITFAPTLSGQTIPLASEGAFLGSRIVIEKSLSIDGSTLNQPVTIDARFDDAFTIAAEANVSISSLSIINAGTSFSNAGTLAINECTIFENLSIGTPEAIIVNTGTIAIVGSTIRGTASFEAGLAVLNRGGSMLIRDSTIQGHRAENSFTRGEAGGILNLEGGIVDLDNVTLKENAGQSAGAIANFGGTVSVHESRIVGNISEFGFGGIHSRDGSLTISKSNVSNNSGGQVGGVSSLDSITAIDCSSIVRNQGTAGGSAGGISHFSPFPLGISSCTIAENIGDRAGAILASGPCNILACTIAKNSSGFRFLSTLSQSPETQIQGSIIRDNQGGDVTAGETPIISLGSNIVGDGNAVSAFIESGDQVGTEIPILLAPLGNYGGPTQTMHPLVGSPAIGAATLPPSVATDQRGKARSSSPDVGAVETGQPILVTTTTEDTTSGRTLRQAISDAEDNGHTIRFDPSVFPETINLDRELVLDSGKSLFLDASNIPGGVTLDAQNRSRAINISDGSTLALHSINIEGGNAENSEDGAGIRNSSELVLINCELRANLTNTGRGGGLWSSGTAQIFDSKISMNTSALGGGLWSGGDLLMRNSTVENNRTTSIGCGGGFLNIGTADIEFTEIKNNLSGTGQFDSGGGGGGIHNQGILDITSCMISGNQTGDGGSEAGAPGTGGHGGGILNMGHLRITKTSVSENQTGRGRDAIFASSLSVSNAVPAKMGGSGGGIANEGTLELNDCQISENTTGIGGYDNDAGGTNPLESQSGHGGGIWNRGQAIIEDCEFRANRTGSSPEFTGLLISSIGGDGGGIANFGGLDLRRSTIDGNETGSGVSNSFFLMRGAIGGGLHNAGQVSAESCTFSNNRSPVPFGLGGGISNQSQSNSSLQNCTIHGNIASSGAGLVNYFGNVDLEHCTITENISSNDLGSGVLSAGGILGEIIFINSIVRDNTGGDVNVVEGTSLEAIVSFGGNVVGTGNAIERFNESSDHIGESTLLNLTPLGDYGGPTQTRLPIPGSPAIDVSSRSLSEFDQRGFSRSSRSNGFVDSGAVEFRPQDDLPFVLPLIWTEDVDGDGIQSGVEHLLRTDPLTAQASGRLMLSLNISGEPEITMTKNLRAVGDGEWVIERSTDLTVWTEVYRSPNPGNGDTTSLDVNQLSSTTFQLTDSSASAPAYYYRFIAERISGE